MKTFSAISHFAILIGLPMVFCASILPVSDLALREEGNPTGPGLQIPDFDGSGEVEFEGRAFLNGANVSFVGTAEKFYNHLLSLNPNYDEDFKDIIAAQDAETDAELAEMMNDSEKAEFDDFMKGANATSLDKRAHKNFRRQCESDKRGSMPKPWGYNYRYLKKINAMCKAPAGGCKRTTCRGTSGIWLCNNKDSGEVSVRCDRVAALSKFAVHGCYHQLPNNGKFAFGVTSAWVQGQKYKVWVERTSTNTCGE